MTTMTNWSTNWSCAYEREIQSMLCVADTVLITSSTAMKGGFFQEAVIRLLPYILSGKKHIVVLQETIQALNTFALGSDPTAAKARDALAFLRDFHARQIRMCVGSEFLLSCERLAPTENRAVLRYVFEKCPQKRFVVLTQDASLADALSKMRVPGQHVAETRRIARGSMLGRFFGLNNNFNFAAHTACE